MKSSLIFIDLRSVLQIEYSACKTKFMKKAFHPWLGISWLDDLPYNSSLSWMIMRVVLKLASSITI